MGLGVLAYEASMKLTTFHIPIRHIELREDRLAFRHDWKGHDMFWIVPIYYVVSMRQFDDYWRIRISDSYFDVNTQAYSEKSSA